MKTGFLSAALLALVLSGAATAAAVPDYVTQAVADPTRPQADIDRDALRLPAKTIAFAGVKPGMKLAELFPGGGYFTRPLSDVVGPSGHIYGIENAKWDDHDLHIGKYGVVDMAACNRHVYESLANPGTGRAQIAALHRIQKSQVIREVEAAGFKLAAQGDALHRTTDDHTKSIFDKSVRGRTDQFMLKFAKP
ncbi:MAG: hypothetical protein WBW93_03485 [Steroidobacteraceae bacterium]